MKVEYQKRKEENTKFILKRFLKHFSQKFENRDKDPLDNLYHSYYFQSASWEEFDSVFKYFSHKKLFLFPKINNDNLKIFFSSRQLLNELETFISDELES